jgi:hypothetical protein
MFAILTQRKVNADDNEQYYRHNTDIQMFCISVKHVRININMKF